VALNASQRTAHALSAGGPDALSPEDRAALPDIDTNDPYHRRQLEAVFGAHAHGAGFDPFYRTMLLWDETMAQTVANTSQARGPRQPLVVFAGGGQSPTDLGSPARVPPSARSLRHGRAHTPVAEAPADRPDS
jgi:hypothetical protein